MSTKDLAGRMQIAVGKLERMPKGISINSGTIACLS